jgi:LysM repeat protein
MQRLLFLLAGLTLFLLPEDSPLSAQEKQEETYSISLIQAAEADKDVKEIDGRKVLTENYEVKKGDYLWRILKEKGVLKRQSFRQVIDLLKQLNTSLTNIDLLHPGETIVIPLVVSPVEDGRRAAPKVQEPPMPLDSLKDVDLDLYTIMPGDSLIKVIKSRYNVNDSDIHDEYLNLLKKMNPSIENIHRVYPGQKIRLPIYSPQVVRMPLPAPPAPEGGVETPSGPPSELMVQVAGVFKAMGVDWLEAGQHFIPLKSGGQINLNADSFPIINLPHGRRVIVDFREGLPERMAALITSSWDNYRIVRVRPSESLREAVDRILNACSYPRVYRGHESLEVDGPVSLRVRADWIVQTEEDPSKNGRFVALNLMEPGALRISAHAERVLDEMGIRVVEYPPSGKPPELSSQRPETFRTGGSAREVVETILRLTGVGFTRDAEIPVYQSRKSDFNLLVKADFLLSGEGRERIVDLTGLGPEIVSLLKDHRFPVLRVEEQSDLLAVISGVLEFAGVSFESKPHLFLAAERDDPRNISIAVEGISFSGPGGERVMVSRHPLSESLKGFLSAMGYRILEIGRP